MTAIQEREKQAIKQALMSSLFQNDALIDGSEIDERLEDFATAESAEERIQVHIHSYIKKRRLKHQQGAMERIWKQG